MTNECSICKNTVLVTQKRIKCNKCQLLLHVECVSSNNNSAISRANWICPSCVPNIRKGGSNINTPINKQSSSDNNIVSFVPSTTTISHSLTGLQGDVSVSNDDFLLAIRNEVKNIITQTVSADLKQIREELSGLQAIKESMEFFSNLYDTIRQELEEAKTEICTLKKSNNELREIIDSHNNTINLLEKETRASNVELHCIPEFKNENLLKTVEQIGQTINLPIDEGCITKCTRLAKLNKSSTRPRTVLVRFSTPILRDRFLAGVINFNRSNSNNKLNTSHLGISGEKLPVYISENLTTTSKDIYAASRKFAKEKHYRFVWSRNGNIFLRKSIASDVIRVKSKDFLKTLD